VADRINGDGDSWRAVVTARQELLSLRLASVPPGGPQPRISAAPALPQEIAAFAPPLSLRLSEHFIQ